MLKSLGILIGGIFVGAVSVEVVRKKCPGTLNRLYERSCEIATEMKDAFKNGYERASQPKTATA